MIRAVLFLQFASFKNTIRQRFQRLRQPRYLFGALAGLAYFYFFFLRHVFHFRNGPHILPELPSDLPQLIEPVAAFVLFVIVVLCWIVPSGRASLTFSEAEVAFLFPAPVSRRSLIHYKLLKSQLAILITSLIISLVTRRWEFLGGNMITHALGWWLIFSFGTLHGIAASFTCERLLDSGLHPGRRRMFASVLLLGLAGVSFVWIRNHLPSLDNADLSDFPSMLRYVDRFFDGPVLAWLLWPLRLVVRPFLAPDFSSFLYAVWPVLLILMGIYVWVLRAEVAFEEASVATSQKRAQRVAAMRAGDWSSARVSTKARREPFLLRPTGSPIFAFLWSNLIALGPAYYARTWVIAAVALTALERWLASDPIYHPFVQMIGLFALIIGCYALLLGPLIVRRGSQRLVQRLEQMKAYPLRGSQVILGELLSPICIVSAMEWILLSVIAHAVAGGALHVHAEASVIFTVAVGIGAILPPVVGLMFGLNFVGILYFPAWTPTGNQPPGIERMGQGLIFFAAYLVVLIACLAPAAAIGGVVLLLVQLLTHNFIAGVILTALVSLAVLGGELYAFVWWLGERYEKFDLSAELPR